MKRKFIEVSFKRAGGRCEPVETHLFPPWSRWRGVKRFKPLFFKEGCIF